MNDYNIKRNAIYVFVEGKEMLYVLKNHMFTNICIYKANQKTLDKF